jgi:hypothetical protein
MFDYFRGNENEQYLTLGIPMMLFRDDRLNGLSGSAKILYSLLLDKTSTSVENGWLDERNRVYVIYTIEEIANDLHCSPQKAVKSMKELREVGLVESVRRGLGQPNLIYVMNFALNKFRNEDTL